MVVVAAIVPQTWTRGTGHGPKSRRVIAPPPLVPAADSGMSNAPAKPLRCVFGAVYQPRQCTRDGFAGFGAIYRLGGYVGGAS